MFWQRLWHQSIHDLSRTPLPLQKTNQSQGQTTDSAEIQYRYGLALARTGKPGMAVWSLRRAQLDPEWAVRAGLELARSALMSKNWANSVESATRVLEAEPDNVDALSIRASAHLGSLAEPELALVDLDRDPEVEARVG